MKARPFGELMRKARVAARVSLKQAAGCIGVSIVYVSEVELSKRPPFSLPRIQALAKLYGVSEDQLVRAAILNKRYVELSDAKPSEAQLEALSGMARGVLSDEQWERIREIVRGEAS